MSAEVHSGHGHSPLAHHFETLEQQKDSHVLGMWAFLASEVLFFGVVFFSFELYRSYEIASFSAGSHHLSILWGTINTLVLLSSSLTMALAVHAAEQGRNRQVVVMLIATIVLGSIFLGIKAMEWMTDWHEHLVPGLRFDLSRFLTDPDVRPQSVQLFFVFYFVMTGLHAVHMIVGVGLLVWLIVLARKNRFNHKESTPVELVGLYWHFVDIVWIFLFPVLYLSRVHH